MKEKAFTLIELIAVIVIIGIIGLIVTPIITGLITSSREKVYEKQIDEIIRSAEKWGTSNNNILPSRDQAVFYLSVNTMKNDGFLKKQNIKNPVNGEYMNGCVLVTYQEDSLQYTYLYDESDCSELDDSTNMTSTDPQYVCYDFNKKTGTIEKYDVNNENCLRDVLIPDKIDSVMVEHIGRIAFTIPSEQICASDLESEPEFVDADYVHYEGDGYEFCSYMNATSTPITSVTFPKNLETIGDHAFAYNLLSTVDIPNTVTKIDNFAFLFNGLTTVTLPDSLNIVEIGVFAGNQLQEVIIPNSVTTIKAGAFSNNELTSINIPNSVTFIGTAAFLRNNIIEGDARIDNSHINVTIEPGAFADNGEDGETMISPVFTRD